MVSSFDFMSLLHCTGKNVDTEKVRAYYSQGYCDVTASEYAANEPRTGTRSIRHPSSSSWPKTNFFYIFLTVLFPLFIIILAALTTLGYTSASVLYLYICN